MRRVRRSWDWVGETLGWTQLRNTYWNVCGYLHPLSHALTPETVNMHTSEHVCTPISADIDKSSRIRQSTRFLRASKNRFKLILRSLLLHLTWRRWWKSVDWMTAQMLSFIPSTRLNTVKGPSIYKGAHAQRAQKKTHWSGSRHGPAVPTFIKQCPEHLGYQEHLSASQPADCLDPL